MADVSIPTPSGNDPVALAQAQAQRNIIAAQAAAAARAAAGGTPINGIGTETAPGASPLVGVPATLANNAARVAQGFINPAPAVVPAAAVPRAVVTPLGGTGTPPAPIDPTQVAAAAANIAGTGTPPLPSGDVSPTPGSGNPLPPNLRDAATPGGVPPLPAGTPVAPNSVAALRAAAPSFGPATYSGGGGAPAALGPNQMGENDLEVVRGSNSQVYQNFNGPSAAAGAAAYAGGGGSGLQDPTNAIGFGFGQQEARGYRTLQAALDYINQGSDIFDRATRGRAIAGILPTAFGPNNQGGVEGAGIDALNSALGGVSQAGIQANAAMYDTGLSTAAHSADVGTEEEGANLRTRLQQSTQPQVVGNNFIQPKDANNKPIGLPVAKPIYGYPQLDDNGHVTGVRTIGENGVLGATPPKEGDKHTIANTTYTYTNGQWKK